MDAAALPPLTGLNGNAITPQEAYVTLRDAMRDASHSDVALRVHFTSNFMTLSDNGVHNLFQVLEYYLVDDTHMTMPEFLASRSELYGPVNRNKCEEVWNGDHIAYRCRTCGLSDSSCMCVGCFDPAQHENHDYRIYRCSYGGCCDCGDDLAWKATGFCSRHQDTAGVGAPVELPTLEATRLHVAVDAILHFGNLVVFKIYEENTIQDNLHQSNTFTHLEQGGSRRRLQSRVSSSFSELSSTSQSLLARFSLSLLWLQSIARTCVPYRTAVCERFLQPIHGLRSFADGSADSLAFWLTFGVLLPVDSCDAVGVLYLKLLMDKPFKKEFSLRFLDAYAFYARLYLGDSTVEGSSRRHLSRYIDRLFCQLFHSSAQVDAIDAMPHQYTDSTILPFVDVTSRRRLRTLHGLAMTTNSAMTLSESLAYCSLQEMATVVRATAGPTLRTGHMLIKQRVYARFCSELRCLLVHPDFCARTIVHSWHATQLGRVSVYQALLDILTTMQCMDGQTKQAGRHVEFESDSWQPAFVLDYEVLLVWQYVVHAFQHRLANSIDKGDVVAMWLNPVVAQMRRWWDADGRGKCEASGVLNVQHQLDFYALYRVHEEWSLHLPLHHLLGSLLDEAHRFDAHELLWTLLQRQDREFWFRLVLHPIHVHLFVRSIKCHAWVLNGRSMFHQVVHYHSRHWRYHGLHNDLFALQLAAAALPPSALTTLVLSQWLPHVTTHMQMLVEGLQLLLQVALDPTKIAALSPWDLLVRDVVHWLAIGPLTRTELHAKCDLRLVEKVKADTFEEDEDIIGRVLAQVGRLASTGPIGDSRSPQMILRELEGGAGGSCTYVLDPSSWALVCPLFESYTATDIQLCDQNATSHDPHLILRPRLHLLAPAFHSRGNMHAIVATHILACRNVLAVIVWVLCDYPKDESLVQMALFYLDMATTVLPPHQVTPPPYTTVHPHVNAIAAKFAGNTWWDHLVCDLSSSLSSSSSVLSLVSALLGSRFNRLVQSIVDRIQSATNVHHQCPSTDARSNSSIVDTVTSSTRPSSSSPPPLSAKERQAQVLAKMKAQQQSFLINQVDVPPDKLPLLFNSTASDDEAFDHMTIVPSSVTLDDQPDVCSLCHDHVTDQVDGLHYMGCVTPSNIATLAQPPLASTNIQCHIRLCGHVVHRPCIWAYVASLYSSNDERLLSRDDAEFLCPVCRRLCNTLVPVALDHHSSAPSADCLLQGAAIRYCEDDVEMDSAPDKLVETALDSLANQVHEYTCQPHTTQQTLTELFLHTLFLTHLALPAACGDDDDSSVTTFLRRHIPAASQLTLRHLLGLLAPSQSAVEDAGTDVVAVVLHAMTRADTLQAKAAALASTLQDALLACHVTADYSTLSSTLRQLGVLLFALNIPNPRLHDEAAAPAQVGHANSMDAWLRFVGVPPPLATLSTTATLLDALDHPSDSATRFHLQRLVWRQPTAFTLQPLPPLYVHIYLQYCQNPVRCSTCHQVPAHPALCLLCGALVCCFSSCCATEDGVGECTTHALKCGVGFGCFLLLRACTV
ncbi:hypothetical protein, variant 1 [Aphanomyces astaci]|nr:hypothetical protein, variant 1 [Aphanomyces astaci]ETV84443.1 hypothetical protein, variant 1 [Aphanomyces astaci]|eukprot:XP_009826135.1 hypothetical protein, variant 1 [Aphanomyces astaci]